MPNLVGIGLSQVPTNGMLGGLAYQDPEHASIKDLDLKNLSQINSEIFDTAVDVFVYDTSKDSDGGAWRKRTTHTSWYNETLGTATRGTRREFPSVAVIVITNNNAGLIIYDGDDPDLPMWMVFNEASGQSIWTGTNRSSVAALNGTIVVGQLTTIPLPIIGFVADEMYNRRTDTAKYNVSNIANRNIFSPSMTGYFTQGLNNSVANDVAMTVLSNAPIDDTTGLPVPTIAVGTDSGVSVIRDDGTVVDLTYQESSNRIVRMIDIDSNGRIYWSTRETGSAPGVYFHEADLPAVDSSAEPPVNISTNQAGATNAVKPTIVKGNLRDVIRTKDRTVLSLSGTDNKGHLNLYNVTGDVNSSGSIDNFEMVDISTDYNTGYIIGDIKGAFLSDTDTTNVTGEKIDLTNGSVPAGNNASVASITANQLVFQSSSEPVGRYNTGTTLVTGKQYHATLTISNYSGSGDLGVASGGGIDATFRYSANGTYTRYITGDDANQIQLFYRNSNTATVGLTIKETDLDRSVNNKGLEVHGTITKSAVATGADLVAYSGFSNSTNYLSQPLNSDLAIGNSEFSSVGWFKKTTSSNTGMIFFANDGSNQVFDVRVHTDMKMLAQITDDGFSTREIVSAQGSTVNDNVWHQYHVVRRGNIMHLYLDGELLGTSASVEANITNSLGVTIGAENLSGNAKAFEGSLALIRFSKSAPSAEQVKKIYEDEKHLFQENAKATLYGSSDNVTAIAYDDSTNLLYAGTSAGRSEFQGLRRINNTTEAVTTAISASNGLVAEQ